MEKYPLSPPFDVHWERDEALRAWECVVTCNTPEGDQVVSVQRIMDKEYMTYCAGAVAGLLRRASTELRFLLNRRR